MKRETREYKVSHDCINVIFGTVSRENPITFYIKMSSWLEPKYCGDYKDDFNIIIYEFKEFLNKKLIQSKLSRRFLFDFDLNFETMVQNDKKYMYIELVFKQNKIFDFAELFNENKEFAVELANCISEKIKSFSFELTKKR